MRTVIVFIALRLLTSNPTHAQSMNAAQREDAIKQLSQHRAADSTRRGSADTAPDGSARVASGSATAASDATGPTMAQTKAWLESEGVRLVSVRYYDPTSTGSLSSFQGHGLELDGCTLAWNTADTLIVTGVFGKTLISDARLIVPLARLDVGGVVADERPASKTRSSGSYSVRMRVMADAGKAIRQVGERQSFESDRATMQVAGREDAARLAKAIRRAAVLCGAAASPY